jgi:hypothetical protein
MTVAGLMNQSKYSHNIIRAGDIMTNAPFTVLNSNMGTVVQLPLPTNLNSTISMDWQQERANILRETLMHNRELMGQLLATTSHKDALQSLDVRAAKAISDSTEDIQNLLARTFAKGRGGQSFVKNPRNEMMFTGVQFKSYSFSFNLVPFTKKDSDSIQKAIREIQKASVPSIGFERMFMIYPETWFITFMDGEKGGNEYLMKINECCCTGVHVNYSPNGETHNMHEGNAPLSVELTLDFTEVYVPCKENIEEFNG